MLDLLSDILTRLSLKGTLYFRTTFTSPWGVRVPDYQNVARFHYAHRGECMVRVGDEREPRVLKQGDLIIIPHGMNHDLYCGFARSPDILPLDRVLDEAGYDGSGVLVYGGEDSRKESQLICGHFSFEENSHHLLYDNLPSSILIENYGAEAGSWMDATLRMIGHELTNHQIGSDLIALKMTEVIFIQALRIFIEREGGNYKSLSGFADPQIARALTAFHESPSDEWTVEGLAREAGLSRTSFAQKFTEKMNITPIKYLTSWRVQLACQALGEKSISIAEVAERVGYASESAFTKVFKKEVGKTPAAYRKYG